LIFPTIQFAAFFAIVLPVSWLLMPRARLWKLFIIAASYVFYGYADWHFVFLLAGCTIWNQTMGVALGYRRVPERVRTLLLGLALAGDLGLLGWFKYYGFFAGSFASMSARFGLPAPLPLLQVALPVGISFYTFQAMSYVIDIRRGRSKPAGWLDFAVYASFFPHLIAGPIVRASELIPQFAAPRDPGKIEAARAFELIVGGLLKKVVLADMIATKLVDPVFGSPNLHSRVDVITAVYGYAIQIYCDFSAYSDMAIGLALLLGFQFPANFNRPYAALTLQDFWRRWHMSLSRWLRDYLYIGLGGNRKGRSRTYVNLMLTMLLGGLWHGAAWNFVLWGGIHGGGLATERWIDERKGTRKSSMPVRRPIVRWFITFNVVCMSWIFFRAYNLNTVGEMFNRVVHGGGVTTLTMPVLAAIVAGLALQFVPSTSILQVRLLFARIGPVPQGIALASILVISGALVSGQGVAPFIYYQF
jgi:alginate O-acetyltransferase complex protein AlgI